MQQQLQIAVVVVVVCSGCYCGGKIDYKLMVELKNKNTFQI